MPLSTSSAARDVFDDLVFQFKENLPDRMAAIHDVFVSLEGQKLRDDRMMELERLSHNLSGISGTFGFEALSKRASELEEMCKKIRNGNKQLSYEDLNKMINVLDRHMDDNGRRAMETEIVSVPVDKSVNYELDSEKFIILVDDDLELADSIGAHLRLLNCQFNCVGDARELENFLHLAPDLIIMDIRFPEDESLGVSIVEKLQSKGVLTCPVIFLSKRDDFNIRLRTVHLNCAGYFIKPFSVNELLYAVQDALGTMDPDPCHVLIVDDDIVMARLSGKFLGTAGMSYDILTNPKDALKALEVRRPDVILLDVKMPGCSGFDLASIIRQDRRYVMIPIIFLTSDDAGHKRITAEKLKADGFLAKGSDPDIIIETVRSRAFRAHAGNSLLARLSKSDRHFRNVAETAGDAIVSIDENGRVVLWSGGASRIFGYTENQMLGSDIMSIIPHRHTKNHTTAFQAACKRRSTLGKYIQTEIEAVDSGGREFPVEMTISQDASGDESYFTAIIRDVTQRAEDERAIRQSEERFRDVAETASDWFWETGPDLRFTYDSAEEFSKSECLMEGVVGKTRPESAGVCLDDLDEEGHRKWKHHLDDLAHRRSFRKFEYEITLKNGGKRVISVSGKPFRNASGEFMGYRGTTTDVTELKLAEQELQRRIDEATSELQEKSGRLEEALAKEIDLNLMQRQFVSMASHEFRTPLAIIDGTVQRIARSMETASKESIHTKLDKIRSAVKRLTGLIESTLSADCMESGRTKFSSTQVDLVAQLSEVCSRYKEISSKIDIRFESIQPPAFVEGDVNLLEQVFINLITNAIKYSPDGGEVSVQLERDGEHYKINVTDQGVGIPEDEVNKLFERFFRSRTSAGIVGTGLGLYLVRQFIDMHGGAISVTSREGHGSAFTVTLPVKGHRSNDLSDQEKLSGEEPDAQIAKGSVE